MNILFLNNFNYRRGGAENVFLEEANMMKKHGSTVHIFSRRHPENFPAEYSNYFPSQMFTEVPKVQLESIKYIPKLFYNVEAKSGLSRVLKSISIDLAHAHNIYGGLTVSVLDLLHKFDVPILMTLHDYKLICPNYKLMHHGHICEDCNPHNYYMAILNKCHKESLIASSIYSFETYFNHIGKKYIRNVQYFISPSKFLKEKFIEFGWPGEKIKYVPNFIDLLEFKTNYEPGNYFLYIGRLSSEKGILTLLGAFKRTKSKIAQLIIVGDGPIRKELEDYAKNDSRIRFTGYLTGDILKDTIRNSLAVIVPSEWYENAPLSILEALAFGKPVIGAKIGGIPEMIEDGYNGYTFKPGDTGELHRKLDLMLNLPRKTIIEMGKAARNKVEKEYTAELHYERLMKIYIDAIQNR